MKKLTINNIKEMKTRGEKISALTAYDYYTAKFLDQTGIDIILIGDSANMVVYGKNSTLSMPMEVMLYHTQAVANAVKRAMVVGDMPFGSYEISPEKALENSILFLKNGAQSVKLEGGLEMIPVVEKLVQSGVPVMGHLGALPQSVNLRGGYPVAGNNPQEAEYIINSAIELQKAGAFSIVLEKVKADIATQITQKLEIPTIGIGAGKNCDGQILVVNDILGLFDRFSPQFAKPYENLKDKIIDAVSRYIADVKSQKFPEDKQTFF